MRQPHRKEGYRNAEDDEIRDPNSDRRGAESVWIVEKGEMRRIEKEWKASVDDHSHSNEERTGDPNKGQEWIGRERCDKDVKEFLLSSRDDVFNPSDQSDRPSCGKNRKIENAHQIRETSELKAGGFEGRVHDDASNEGGPLKESPEGRFCWLGRSQEKVKRESKLKATDADREDLPHINSLQQRHDFFFHKRHKHCCEMKKEVKV